MAFTFPGQGSQRPGMGRPWVDHESWELVGEASEVAGRDVGQLLLDADADELKDTRNAQLTTFVSSLMVLDAVDELTRAGAALLNAHRDRVLSSFELARNMGALDENTVRNAVSVGSMQLGANLQALAIPGNLKLQPRPLELPGARSNRALSSDDDWEIKTF